jgi:SPP1 gp7 family putative phage head morphogenesis protein
MHGLQEEVGGGTINITNRRISRYIGRRVDMYAGSVNETSKQVIDRILSDGVTAGLSIDDMAHQISAYFDAAQIGRAQTVAQTEVVTSMNFGRREAMGQLGYDSHRWMTQRDSDVRDSHASADGQVVKLGEEFTDLGADYGGDRTYPSDFNERCFTIPVKSEE